MGATVTGMQEWLDVLRTVEERADKAFPPIMGKAGFNMKDDWNARWKGMPHEHLPHLVGSTYYKTDKSRHAYTVEVGPRPGRPQYRLASFIEFGTLTSGPHPAGEPALQAEIPRMSQYAEEAAAKLLEGDA